jgi:hypothetical protein
MSTQKMKAEEVEALAESLGIKLLLGNAAATASMLSEVRQNVYMKASSLAQDAPSGQRALFLSTSKTMTSERGAQ